MADDGGVLGNLPNSRPGKRSAKREAGAGRPAKSAARAAAKAETEGKAAAKPVRKSRTTAKPGRKAAGAASPKARASGRRTAAPKGDAPGDGVVVDRDIRGEVRHDPVPPPLGEDPVGAVVRTATEVAVTGVRVAGALTREVFKRLPRP
jgi:hypothetical protein